MDFGMLCALLGPEFEGALVNASATAGDKMATAATGWQAESGSADPDETRGLFANIQILIINRDKNQ